MNEFAGPDGGDGGNGGHVVFHATKDVTDFRHLTSIYTGRSGDDGGSKGCHGKNADHSIVKVPVGTIIKNSEGRVIGDLERESLMFVAARGGSGGKGNTFFISDTNQAPDYSEYGAIGEDNSYFLELRSMANVGFIGLPNAGKSTLLQAITRAKPKVASYPFTTLKPHLGMIPYDDYQQVAVADLPGLIPGSAENRGLGIQFLKHAERCNTLLFVIDMSSEEPWEHYNTLIHEISKFSEELVTRKKIIAANKIDVPEAEKNIEKMKEMFKDLPVIPISAKFGTNIEELLNIIREYYDEQVAEEQDKEARRKN
jgi:GTPase